MGIYSQSILGETMTQKVDYAGAWRKFEKYLEKEQKRVHRKVGEVNIAKDTCWLLYQRAFEEMDEIRKQYTRQEK